MEISGVFRTQSNIYDGAFFAKIVLQKNSIVDDCLGSKYVSDARSLYPNFVSRKTFPGYFREHWLDMG